MTLNNDAPLFDVTASTPQEKKPEKLAEAARQFEALMIGELLKSAGADGNSWLGEDADNASETAMGMAQTEFAQAMAHRGGFGLAGTIERALTRPAGSKQPAVEQLASKGKD